MTEKQERAAWSFLIAAVMRLGDAVASSNNKIFMEDTVIKLAIEMEKKIIEAENH